MGRALYSVGFWIRETGQALDRLGCRLQGKNHFREQRTSFFGSFHSFDCDSFFFCFLSLLIRDQTSLKITISSILALFAYLFVLILGLSSNLITAFSCLLASANSCCLFPVSRHRTLMNVFDKAPLVDKDAFVAPSASIIGNVHLGPGSSIWYGCVLRGTPPPHDVFSFTTKHYLYVSLLLFVQEMLTPSLSELGPISKITPLSTLPSPT